MITNAELKELQLADTYMNMALSYMRKYRESGSGMATSALEELLSASANLRRAHAHIKLALSHTTSDPDTSEGYIIRAGGLLAEAVAIERENGSDPDF